MTAAPPPWVAAPGEDVTSKLVASGLAALLGGLAAPVRAEPADSAPATVSAPASTEPSTWSQVGTGALVLGLCEGLFLGYSAVAANYPQQVGWTMVAFTPLAAASGGSANAATQATVVGMGAGLGLYDALELKADRYTRSQRFWRNMAAWHLLVVTAGVVGWATDEGGGGAGPGPAAGAPQVSLGLRLTADGPALVLGGRF